MSESELPAEEEVTGIPYWRLRGVSDRLSILQVITPSRYSGAEQVVVFLSAALEQAGHQVVVATKANERLEDELAKRGVEVHTPGIAGKTNLAAPGRIARLAREIDADIIHTHLSTASLWGSVAARRMDIPALAHVHALNRRWWYGMADAIVTPSQGVRQHLIGQGVDPACIHAIYNGIPAERFASLPPPQQVREELGLPEGVTVVGVVAHLSPKKGHKYLLEAVAKLSGRHPELHCLIVGSGPLAARLPRLAEQLRIAERTYFLGYREDAVAIMQLCDIVALPSVAKEGLGLCLIEAAFVGVPTVGSQAPGIDEAIVDGETGLLVPPGDATALAEGMDRLLADSELRRRLGESGRQRAEKLFTVEAQAAATAALYRQMTVAGKRSGY